MNIFIVSSRLFRESLLRLCLFLGSGCGVLQCRLSRGVYCTKREVDQAIVGECMSWGESYNGLCHILTAFLRLFCSLNLYE